jgi:SAM-dependent methyltransferase
MMDDKNLGEIMGNRSDIENYWENPDTVSLIDLNLRKLETEAVLKELSKNDRILDLGCGAGESTVFYARAVKECVAYEQSIYLISKAKNLFLEQNLSNIEVVKGDALNLDKNLGKFDVVITQRVIINFMTWEEQKNVILGALELLKTGGRFIMIENTFDGFENLNEKRRLLGLSNIILHDWHNYFLNYNKFLEFMKEVATLEKEENFNTYYLLTRLYSNLVAKFEGYGINAQKDEIFEKLDEAAYNLHKVLNDTLSFKMTNGTSFGPIQKFVFRKTP